MFIFQHRGITKFYLFCNRHVFIKAYSVKLKLKIHFVLRGQFLACVCETHTEILEDV